MSGRAKDGPAAEQAITLFLPLARAAVARSVFRRRVLEDVQKKLNPDQRHGNTVVLRIGSLLVQVAKFPEDLEALCCLCRYMVVSMEAKEREKNLASVFLTTKKSQMQSGSRLVSGLFRILPAAMNSVEGNRVSEQKAWQNLVHWMLVFSSPSTWFLLRSAPQLQSPLLSLCNKMSAPLHTAANHSALSKVLLRSTSRGRPLLTSEALSALFSLLLRPLKQWESSSLEVFLLPLLLCPAVLLHINDVTREQIVAAGVLPHVMEERLPRVEGSGALSLLGNIVHLSYLHLHSMQNLPSEWSQLILSLLQGCENAAAPSSQTHIRQFHPIFGNCALLLDYHTEMSLQNVLQQLRLLWSRRIIRVVFSAAHPTVAFSGSRPDSQSSHNEPSNHSLLRLWKRLRVQSDNSIPQWHSMPPSASAGVAFLYLSTLRVFKNLWAEILSGLCAEKGVLSRLWESTRELGVHGDSLSLSLHLDASPSPAAALHLAPLHLFAEAASYLIKILDDSELYEGEQVLPLDELVIVARFTNLFCFRCIWNNVVDSSYQGGSTLFSSLHSLCIILYSRHSRRPLCNDSKLWLPGDVRSSLLLSEFEKQTPRGILLMKKMSHVVPLKERMLLFRKFISGEKSAYNRKTTMMRVQRTQLLEDGFRHLSSLSPNSLRGAIRVKFVNQQGLDEAGIDQDGVFKEFLELTLKQVFNPALSLFCFTSAGQLHPSCNSQQQENHLDLFKFVGKMLAKAVYEGIVVDVQMAPVMLASLLGVRSLGAFDELAQFDPELYRSLSYVKKCDEKEVADLALTFSIDENRFGEIVTVDIVPCGRTIQVTAENRISYVHRMAHYRVFAQTAEQCNAFVDGFQCVVTPSWLSLFSPHELQILISGQSSDIDLVDLRRHVQYYGGFHSGHRLIKWLWQILEQDFSSDERRLFLKFVTSCSRGPLLGFGCLEPPFSIRCVEVSDDVDTGDTLGSVVRGFLAMKKEQANTRLPTASTCFNLLKLPNYNKKSTLLQKLRYAIHSETGFELS